MTVIILAGLLKRSISRTNVWASKNLSKNHEDLYYHCGQKLEFCWTRFRPITWTVQTEVCRRFRRTNWYWLASQPISRLRSNRCKKFMPRPLKDGCSHFNGNMNAEIPIKLLEIRKNKNNAIVACGWKVENHGSEKNLDPTLNALKWFLPKVQQDPDLNGANTRKSSQKKPQSSWK